MAGTFFRSRTARASYSRYFAPRLEALEDRFLPSGSPLAASVTSTITSLNLNPQQEIVLPDGKILLGLTVFENGQFLPLHYNSSVDPRLIMGSTIYGIGEIELILLNANGTLDTTFGNDGISIIHSDLSDYFSSFALAPDGSIIVAGTEVSSGDGYLVPSGVNWPPGWPPTGLPGEVEVPFGITGDVPLWVGGSSAGPSGGAPGYDFVWQDSGLSLFRVSANGTLDASFQAENVPGFHLDTMGEYGTVGGVTVQPDGKIVVAGEELGFGNSTVFVARYNADGTFDASFNPGGAQPGVATTSITNPPIVPDSQYPPSSYPTGYGWVSTVAVEADGNIVVGASESAYGMVVLQYNSDGSADDSFGTDGMATYSAGPNSLVYLSSVTVQPDGKILAAGTLSGLPGTVSANPLGGLVLVRFDMDGTFDSTFGQGGVVQFATNADPLGPFSVYRPALPNESEPLGPVESGYVWTATVGVIVQPDGKIDVAGRALADQAADFVGQGLVAQFNADGSPDTTFGQDGVQFTTLVSNATTYLSVDPMALATAPDGSLLVIGNLDYGSYIPFPDPSDPPLLVLLDYQNAPVGGSVTPSSIGLPAGLAGGSVTPSSIGVPAGLALSSSLFSDVAFQMLASEGGHSGAGLFGSQVSNNLAASLIATLSPTIPLPIPTESQSEQVARLSGGGGKSVSAFDDSFGLTDDLDGMWNLVLATGGDAPG